MQTISNDSMTSSENSAHAGPVLRAVSLIVGLLKHPGGLPLFAGRGDQPSFRVANANINAVTFATPALEVTIDPSSRDRLARVRRALVMKLKFGSNI
jgi:hypothetical protein